MVERKYRVISKIGEGTFGKIFKGVNIHTNTYVAIKIETSATSILMHEAKIYKNLEDVKGIPKMLSYGKEGKYNYLVLTLYDMSLEELKESCGGRLPLKSVIDIALQTIERISMIHEAGILHRDIKPDNLMVDTKTNEIYVIDFGLAKRYVDEENKHLPMSENRKLTGTARYASINTHKGITPSRRDDLESLGFVLIYLLQGYLPWQDIDENDKEKRIEKIRERKEGMCLKEELPGEFITYISYCRRLEYEEEPDYEYMKNVFENLKKLKRKK